MSDKQTHDFFRQTRSAVKDLYDPSPEKYWLDMIATLLVAYGSATVFLHGGSHVAMRLVAFLIAGPALYRLATFIHEIAHFRSGEMVWFRRTWNTLAGIPLLMPAHFYNSHLDHHNTHLYGTENDGEYLPLGKGPVQDIAVFLSQVFFQPILVTLRFLFLTPISFLHPSLRKWTLERASSLVIDFKYRNRRNPRGSELSRNLVEIACSVRAWLMMAIVLFGFAEWTYLLSLYVLAVYSLGLNHIRTLAAHRFMNNGEKMTREGQLMDSTNIVGGNVFSHLLFPIGTRYHALHHLFPRLPYHNLAAAHQRLMLTLPAESIYRDTVYTNWTAVVKELLENSFANSQEREHIMSSEPNQYASNPPA